MRKFLFILAVTVLTVAVVFSLGLTNTYKSTKHAWLGVWGQSIDRDMAEAYGLPSEYGVIIDRVSEDSPAEKAGLVENDIIIGFNSDRVRDYDDLVDMIADRKPGDEVTLSIMRDGQKQELKVALEGKPRNVKYDESWVSGDDVKILRVPRAPRVPDIADIPNIKKLVYISDGDGSYIGVTMTALTEQLGEYFGVEKGNGVLVTEVEEDSPAHKAGLKAGDVIMAVNEEKVFDFKDVGNTVREKNEGDKLSVTVMRDKKQMSFDVTVEKRAGRQKERTFKWYSPDDIEIDISDLRSGYHQYYFDAEEFEADMEELAEDMEELKIELQDMDIEIDEELREELREELQELKEELRELEDDLD